MILRRYVFLLSLAAGALLVLAAPSVAQHSQSQSQRVGLFLTQVARSDQPVSHSRVLYLPPLAAAAITTKPSSGGTGGGSGKTGGGGKKGGGGSTACPTSGTKYHTYSVDCPVAPTTTVPEAEEEIAADPGTTNYVAAVSDFSLRGGLNTTKWAITTDGGSTWTQNFVPLGAHNDPVTSDGMVWGFNSDPDVAIDNSGNVYLSDLYASSSPATYNVLPNGLYVSSDTTGALSTGGNFSNTEPVLVNTATPAAGCDPNGIILSTYEGFCLEDKPWVAVDNSSGNVYVVWDHWWSCYDLGFGGISCNSGPDIYLAYSTDHGRSWKVWRDQQSNPIPIDQGTIPTGQSQSGIVEGPQVAVGPGGTVYIAYEAFDPGSNTRWQYLTWSSAPTVTGSGSAETLSFAFSTPSNVTSTTGFQDLNFNTGLNATSSYRVNSFPALAVGRPGEVYIEYADQVSTNSVIEFVHCTRAATITDTPAVSCGTTVPVSGSSTTGQEFFPAISVDSSGVIHTSWFDTRNSSSTTADFDVYANFDDAYSTSPVNNGWEKNVTRVTPTTINTGVATFIGDYSGIAAGPSGLKTAHPVWNDFSETCGRITCKGSGTMQTTTLTLPSDEP